MGERKGFGDRATYAMLEERAMVVFHQFTDREASHLMYAFASRGFGNKSLHQRIVKHLHERLEHYDYQALYNTV